MRYYFVIFLAERSFYRKAKGRGKNSRFFQTLAKMGFFLFLMGFWLRPGGAREICCFSESHRRFSSLPFPQIGLVVKWGVDYECPLVSRLIDL